MLRGLALLALAVLAASYICFGDPVKDLASAEAAVKTVFARENILDAIESGVAYFKNAVRENAREIDHKKENQ